MDEIRENEVTVENEEMVEKTNQNETAEAMDMSKSTAANVKTMDKNVHTWVFCFLLGGFGVDRFVRGQIACGIFKLLFGWLTLGIWATVDWIIAMVKAYGNSFKEDRDFTFINGKYAK